jgi:dTDP-4-dehydrorhamnose 3,5-epimerase
MKLQETSLPGVLLIELAVFGDHRGRFIETFRRQRYLDAGVATGLEFVQDNFSSSARGTLRGLHHQLTQPQGKLVHVTRGAVFDVVVDIRRGSPCFGKWFGHVLSEENHMQMWVPPGFAHGFAVLSESADFVYKVTAEYAAADERAIRWDDPEIGIVWPSEGEPTLSARDRSAATLRESELPLYVP